MSSEQNDPDAIQSYQKHRFGVGKDEAIFNFGGEEYRTPIDHGAAIMARTILRHWVGDPFVDICKRFHRHRGEMRQHPKGRFVGSWKPEGAKVQVQIEDDPQDVDFRDTARLPAVLPPVRPRSPYRKKGA